MSANIRTLFLLSLIAGFVDSATFIHLHELFSAHVTGNFVVLAAAIGKGARSNDALKLLAFRFSCSPLLSRRSFTIAHGASPKRHSIMELHLLAEACW